MVSLGGRHFLKRYNEMADEPVDNVGNICIQIFYGLFVKKIKIFFERQSLKRSIIEYIWIVRVNRKRNQDNYFPPFQIDKDKSSSDKNVT